ncbi:MAG: PqqD family protein [Armatimonadota bacterium]
MIMIYRRADNIISRTIAGETLLIPVTQIGVDLQKVYLLNETAAAIWKLLEQPRDVPSMVASLLEEYEANAAVVERGVTAVVEELLQRSMVTVEQA